MLGVSSSITIYQLTMSWPEWPKLPQIEFPPKELPVFLHPLRLIPHYKRQVGGAIRSFLQRDDNR
jgi:hypothetical protein